VRAIDDCDAREMSVIVTNRFTRRLKDHIALALAGLVVGAIVYWVAPTKDSLMRLSLSSAYVSLALLTITLAIGPMNALRGARRPVSIDSRRDVGIWAAIWSILHTVIGLQVHLRGRMSEYFFQPGDQSLLTRLRHDMFGFANYAGLAAAIIVLLLAAISNDLSLRWLGAGRWKRVQQLNYVLFTIVVVHAILYQIIEKRNPPFAFAIGFLAAMAIVLQVARAMCRAGKTPLTTN
jgi:methionine sulfoxide reductase heme-binding subunit